MPVIRHTSSRPLLLEKIFFERYADLTTRALKHTRGDAAQADDLVQELFVQVVLLENDAIHIERAENYLFTCLRNLHYARARRADSSALDNLTIVDFDTVQRGLFAIDRSELLFVQADLNHICQYLCERKTALRAASILILRYYLGYLPSEIMKVAKISRTAFDKSIVTARQEVQRSLLQPASSAPVQGAARQQPPAHSYADNPQALFHSLRSRIFDACSGECIGSATLRAKYSDKQQSFATEELAHLVSCAACLDEANKILGLPLLSERSAEDSLDRDKPSDPGGPGPMLPRLHENKQRPKKGNDLKRHLQRCAQEVFEHRPRQLRVAIDGEIRVSQAVTAEFSELQVNLTRSQQPRLIEVLSEQGVCLAVLMIEDSIAHEQVQFSRHLAFSDARWMELSLSFAVETPLLRLVYQDPLLRPQDAQDEAEETINTGALVAPVKASESAAVDRFANLRDGLRRLLHFTIEIELRPMLASMGLFGILVAAGLLLWMGHRPEISTTALLGRALVNDAGASSEPGVIYQKLRITTAKGQAERSIYRDRQAKRRPRAAQLTPADQRLSDSLAKIGVSWSDPLSASSFKAWRDQQSDVHDVVTRPAEHLLTVTTEAGSGPAAVKETLTVRDQDFHVVERTVVLPEEGTVEIAELEYATLPWSSAAESWFEPLASETSARARPHTMPATKLHAALTDVDVDEAELSVRLALNELGADTNERISLERQPSGVSVKGIVADARRKQEIVQRLAPIPHVLPTISTFEEHEARAAIGSGASITHQVVSESAQSSILEEYLVSKGREREQARAAVADLFEASVVLDQQSRETVSLLHDFGSRKKLSLAAQNNLAVLLEMHRSKLLSAIRMQETILANTGMATSSLPFTSTPDTGIRSGFQSKDVNEISTLAEQDVNACRALTRSDGQGSATVLDVLQGLAHAVAGLDVLAGQPFSNTP